MKRDPIQARVLATKLIPNVAPDLAEQLSLRPEERSLALITADNDDVTYTALDEATKKRSAAWYTPKAAMRARTTRARAWQARLSASWPRPIRRRPRPVWTPVLI